MDLPAPCGLWSRYYDRQRYFSGFYSAHHDYYPAGGRHGLPRVWQAPLLAPGIARFQTELRQQLFRAQKAQQRIIASYGITDPERRIALLKSAIETDPDSFNGYNALGYAYLEQGDTHAAIAAFQEATIRHPDAKERH